MDLAALRSRFRSISKDSATPYLTEDPLLDEFLNEAVSEAAIRKRLIFDKTTPAVCQIAVTAGIAIYPLHASIFEVEHAYLVDASDNAVDIAMSHRAELDYKVPGWRGSDSQPNAIIIDEQNVELSSSVDASYTLYLEVYRVPIAGATGTVMIDTNESPEIGTIHHKYLPHWALYEHYSRDDADIHAPGKAKDHLERFERYFGKRTQAKTPSETAIPLRTRVHL